jgi:hypothetical protein
MSESQHYTGASWQDLANAQGSKGPWVELTPVGGGDTLLVRVAYIDNFVPGAHVEIEGAIKDGPSVDFESHCGKKRTDLLDLRRIE